MNRVAQNHHPRLRPAIAPVRPGSARLHQLFDAIGAGAFVRERDDVHPFEAYALIREYGFGAFRVPVALGGGGATLVELIEGLIDLAAIDPNVAHALRSHFLFVEAHLPRFAGGLDGRWLEEILAGALFGNANTELGTKNTGGPDSDRRSTS